MMMFSPDALTQAEDRHAEMLARKEARSTSAAETLSAEYMAAACLPTIATVAVPTDREPGRRWPFIRVFEDDLSAPDRMARAISILMRSVEGRELVQEMADAHGENFAEFAL